MLLEQLEVAPGGEFRGCLVEEVGCQITQSVTGQVSLLPSFFHENFLKAHELLPLPAFSQQSLLLLKSPSVKRIPWLFENFELEYMNGSQIWVLRGKKNGAINMRRFS